MCPGRKFDPDPTSSSSPLPSPPPPFVRCPGVVQWCQVVGEGASAQRRPERDYRTSGKQGRPRTSSVSACYKRLDKNKINASFALLNGCMPPSHVLVAERRATVWVTPTFSEAAHSRGCVASSNIRFRDDRFTPS